MPSPVMHAAAGLAVSLLDRGTVQQYKGRYVALLVSAAILPDLDFIPGMVLNEPNLYHSSWSHSLGFAAAITLIGRLVFRGLSARGTFWLFVAAMSHCVLDALTVDGRPPYGVPLFWPLSSHTFHAPFLPGVSHGSDGTSLREFLASVFSLANIYTVLLETAVGGLVIGSAAMIGRFVRTRSNRQQ